MLLLNFEAFRLRTDVFAESGIPCSPASVLIFAVNELIQAVAHILRCSPVLASSSGSCGLALVVFISPRMNPIEKWALGSRSLKLLGSTFLGKSCKHLDLINLEGLGPFMLRWCTIYYHIDLVNILSFSIIMVIDFNLVLPIICLK